MMSKLWNDEAGIVALEYLLVATIVGLGVVVGLATLAKGLNVELVELANAIEGLSQAYTINSVSTCVASKAGSAVTDAASSFTLSGSSVAATAINVTNCP